MKTSITVSILLVLVALQLQSCKQKPNGIVVNPNAKVYMCIRHGEQDVPLPEGLRAELLRLIASEPHERKGPFPPASPVGDFKVDGKDFEWHGNAVVLDRKFSWVGEPMSILIEEFDRIRDVKNDRAKLSELLKEIEQRLLTAKADATDVRENENSEADDLHSPREEVIKDSSQNREIIRDVPQKSMTDKKAPKGQAK